MFYIYSNKKLLFRKFIYYVNTNPQRFKFQQF